MLGKSGRAGYFPHCSGSAGTSHSRDTQVAIRDTCEPVSPWNSHFEAVQATDFELHNQVVGTNIHWRQKITLRSLGGNFFFGVHLKPLDPWSWELGEDCPQTSKMLEKFTPLGMSRIDM